jgi:hypothetical protein
MGIISQVGPIRAYRHVPGEIAIIDLPGDKLLTNHLSW